MLTRIRLLPTVVSVMMSLGAGSLYAQSASPSAASGVRADQGADSKFVTAAATGGITEAKLGQLATVNGGTPSVKTFGQHMVDDHGKANDELAGIASKKGYRVPAAPDKAHQQVVDKFSTLQGKDFDKAYWKQMLVDHQKTIALFKAESESGKDADIKAFASRTLPTLQKHLQMVHDGMSG